MVFFDHSSMRLYVVALLCRLPSPPQSFALTAALFTYCPAIGKTCTSSQYFRVPVQSIRTSVFSSIPISMYWLKYLTFHDTLRNPWSACAVCIRQHASGEPIDYICPYPYSLVHTSFYPRPILVPFPWSTSPCLRTCHTYPLQLVCALSKRIPLINSIIHIIPRSVMRPCIHNPHHHHSNHSWRVRSPSYRYLPCIIMCFTAVHEHVHKHSSNGSSSYPYGMLSCVRIIIFRTARDAYRVRPINGIPGRQQHGSVDLAHTTTRPVIMNETL